MYCHLTTDIETTGSERKWKSNEPFQSLQTFTKIKCFNTDQGQVSTQGAFRTYISQFDQKS